MQASSFFDVGVSSLFCEEFRISLLANPWRERTRQRGGRRRKSHVVLTDLPLHPAWLPTFRGGGG